MAVDPKVLAMRLAVARWKKLPDDGIAQELDDPHEWVREAVLMNQFLPGNLLKEGFAWQNVHPAELKAAQIKLVRQYAGFIFTHTKPLVLMAAESIQIPEEIVPLGAAAAAAGPGFDDHDSTRLFGQALGMSESDIDALFEE